MEDEYQYQVNAGDSDVFLDEDKGVIDTLYDDTTVSISSNQHQQPSPYLYQEEDEFSHANKFSYVELTNLIDWYLRLIHNQKIHISNFHSTLVELIRQAESNLSTHTSFGTTISTENHSVNSPVRAALGQDRRGSRLKSRYEHASIQRQTTRKKRKTLSLFSGNDANFIDFNFKGKCCIFCGGQGHKIQGCRKKLDYGQMLPQNEQFKLEFTKQLKQNSHFKMSHRQERRKPINNSIPTCRGIVIHEKVSKDILIISLILKGSGDLHDLYQHYPFDIDTVCTYINTFATTRIVISNLLVNTNRNESGRDINDYMSVINPSLSQNSYN